MGARVGVEVGIVGREFLVVFRYWVMVFGKFVSGSVYPRSLHTCLWENGVWEKYGQVFSIRCTCL